MESKPLSAHQFSVFSASNQGQVTVTVAPTTIRAMLDGQLNAKLGEYCCLVHGRLGDLMENQTANPDGPGLEKPTAIFRGLKRPFLDQHLDKGVQIYVTNPKFTFDYPAAHQFDGRSPRRLSAPANAVFTTYIDFSLRAIDEAKASPDYRGPATPAGVVLYWAWTRASVLDRHLPHEYRTRYEQQVHP